LFLENLLSYENVKLLSYENYYFKEIDMPEAKINYLKKSMN